MCILLCFHFLHWSIKSWLCLSVRFDKTTTWHAFLCLLSMILTKHKNMYENKKETLFMFLRLYVGVCGEIYEDSIMLLPFNVRTLQDSGVYNSKHILGYKIPCATTHSQTFSQKMWEQTWQIQGNTVESQMSQFVLIGCRKRKCRLLFFPICIIILFRT